MSLALDAARIRSALDPVHPTSPETAERLAAWSGVLDRWSRAQRLVGWRTAHDLLHRGILDCWQARALLADANIGAGLDVGSGAGFPGLILAADLPGVPFHLVEARRKRAAFLREAARAMNLSEVVVHHGRADEVRAHLGIRSDTPDPHPLARRSGSHDPDPDPDPLLFASRAFAAPADALTEAAAWNAQLALVSTSRARVAETPAWPPEGWTSLNGNFGRASSGDHHEFLRRTAHHRA